MSEKIAASSSLTPTQRALLRFRRNRAGVFGVWLISIATVIALLGYSITPDATPSANDQINEIRDAPLRFSILMLKIRKNRPFEAVNPFQKILYGTENPYQLLPVTATAWTQDSLKVSIYQGEDEAPKPAAFAFADIVFPLSATQQTVRTVGAEQHFFDLEGQPRREKLSDLRQLIEREHLAQRTFWLGTDHFGRDVLSRLMLGVRVSLLIGFVAVAISLFIGVSLGAVAGYYGGRTDRLIMLLINTVWSIPTLLLVFALVIALGRGFWQIFLAVGLTMWVDVARIVRGQVLSVKTMLFVEAGKSFGFSDFRIIFRHILPNILGPVLVIAAANFATAILIEAGLSYLGFGIQPPQPSWGNMLKDGYGYFISSNIYPALFPGLSIMLMVLAFNLVGNALRDALGG